MYANRAFFFLHLTAALINSLIADTVLEWIQSIESFMEKPDKKVRIQNNARQFAESHFDNKFITKELIQFYKEVQK